jgi:hypothetical protein
LLDIIQLGEIVPFFNTVKKEAAIDRHEVHDLTNELLISNYNKFDHGFGILANELGGTEESNYNVQRARGSVFKKYKGIVDLNEAPTIALTSENIHEVKVVLIGNSSTATKPTGKSTFWSFKILAPHFMPD